MLQQSYVYIIASQKNGTIYIGVSSDLIKRIGEHKQSFIKGFAKRYSVNNLVYYEIFDNIEEAIKREKVLKGLTRAKKIALFEETNPNWDDLYDNLF